MSDKQRSIVYIAYHYPPVVGSSGVHRTVAFTRHLASQNWSVRVLTASLKAYINWSEEQFSFIPENVSVIRAFARDVSRHFSWRNKYLGIMALPDNWQSWIPGGVIAGLWSFIKQKPDIIVSTYPIASAHIIGYFLHKLTGVPWVADLRDPMAQVDYPTDQRKKRWFKWIERKIVKHCEFAMVTAPGAKALYEERFADTDKDFWKVVPNGYDEAIFSKVPNDNTGAEQSRPFTLLHSGVIYPTERDPSQLFGALSHLKTAGDISGKNFRILLRATGHDDLFRKQIDELDIADIVELAPTVPYKKALKEMFEVDALLLLQAESCNYQIPAKAYEYIRVGKPVLALTPREGDTGSLLEGAGVAEIAPLDQQEAIINAIRAFLAKCRAGEFTFPEQEKLASYSRQYHAATVEKLLGDVVDRRS